MNCEQMIQQIDRDSKKERIKVKLPDSWELLSQDHYLFDNAKFRDYWGFFHQDHFIIYITSDFGKLNGVRFSTSYYVHIKIEVDEDDELEAGEERNFPALIIARKMVHKQCLFDKFIQKCYNDKE